jgi:arsenite-transporting ATPase
VTYALAGRRTLLVSTDPAPSVGDALKQRLRAAPRRVKGVSNLFAAEVDAPTALGRWLDPRRTTLETIALRGTFLDQDDVAALLGLSLPGIDEIAALMEVGRLGRSGAYDIVVVDTAPTGHTLRMLATPALLSALAVVFDRMHRKHRTIVEALRGRWTPDVADGLIESIAAEGQELAALLTDRRHAVMTLITLPEPMAIAESRDALRELRRLGVHVDAVVINRLTPAPDRSCRWCQARRAFERTSIRSLTAAGGKPTIRTIAARVVEPRTVTALRGIGREMAATPRLPRRRPPMAAASRPTAVGRNGVRPFSLQRIERLSLVLLGGKGGVGKTTCAAAIALRAAAASRDRRVTLMSADPAHSLADVLGIPLGNDPRRVPGTPPNLTAREIDAAALFDAIKTRYASAIDALFGRLTNGSQFDVSADRAAMRDLIELAPPGLDELMAMVEIGDAIATTAEPTPLVVVDTAPSGHALRLLELPGLVHEWVKTLMAIVLKYQPVVGVGELGEILLHISQGLGRLRALLTDPSRTAFVSVTRPAALPAAETRRVLRQLHRLRIPAPAVIVNAAGLGNCSTCTIGRREQQRALKQIRADAKGKPLAVAPAVMPPPHGPESLRAWGGLWIE